MTDVDLEQQNARERRGIDASIAALSALAFLKDEDVVNASLTLSNYYAVWGEPNTMLEAANALLGAVLGVARDLAKDSDTFRLLTVDLVARDG